MKVRDRKTKNNIGWKRKAIETGEMIFVKVRARSMKVEDVVCYVKSFSHMHKFPGAGNRSSSLSFAS